MRHRPACYVTPVDLSSALCSSPVFFGGGGGSTKQIFGDNYNKSKPDSAGNYEEIKFG
jgi:hypothetical protein